MAKVYVMGALMPMGGGYMAYHLGRLLHLHFGYDFISVNTNPKVQKTDVFHYDIPFGITSVPEMECEATQEDLFVINPSYSHVLFGLRLPGRKIMYIQDFRTFHLLDCHFDLYVSVSSLVSRAIEAVYSIQTPVIPAFIHTNPLPQYRPWHERPPGSAVVYIKNESMDHRLLLDYVAQALKKNAPYIDLSHVLKGGALLQSEFFERLGAVQYLVSLSLVEGFGLVPLEAMALGTMVTGLDGLAGVDYMRSGHNCLVGSSKNLRLLPAIIQQAFDESALAASCVLQGKITAAAYSYASFKAAWLAQFSRLLQSEPRNV